MSGSDCALRPAASGYGVERSAIFMDDDADICNIATFQLREIGIETRACCTASELSSSLEAHHPDLLFLDLCLGATDAIEVFALLRAHAFNGEVVLVSGQSSPVLEHARRIGTRSGINVTGVVTKPFRRPDLERVVAPKPLEFPDTSVPSPPLAESGLLTAALTEGWIEFWCQPKIDILTEDWIGGEMLARIRHPERGVVSPDAFLPGADADDLYRLALLACTAAHDFWLAASAVGREFTPAINLPGNAMQHPTLLNDLREVRRRFPRYPRLVLEVTETDLIEESSAAEEFATRAALHGFSLSIDDFGSGYATFNRLRTMPFSELKLERAVVHGCADDHAAARICRAAVELGHGFGANVVAEGVERPEDLAALRRWGFDIAQGYLFSRPLPMGEFTRRLGAMAATGPFRPLVE